jgi:hypothetical protein
MNNCQALQIGGLLVASVFLLPVPAQGEPKPDVHGEAPASQLTIVFSANMESDAATQVNDANVGCPVAALLVDNTPSVAQGPLQAALERIIASLDAFLPATGCCRLRLCRFADLGSWTPAVEYAIPAPPAAVAGPTITPVVDNPVLRGLCAARPEFCQYLLEQETRRRAAAQESTATAFVVEQQHLMSQVAAYLRQNPGPEGNCTALVDLLEHLLGTLPAGSTIVVVSDGAESCLKQLPRMTLPRQLRLLFVLVPSRGDLRVTGPEAEARMATWSSAMPGIEWVLYTEVSSSCWQGHSRASMSSATF